MNRHVFAGAFALGTLAAGWVAWGFWGTNTLALLMTLVIMAVYSFGALELYRFRQASASLASALRNIPQPLPDLEPWLAGVHPSLQNAVRARIEGERVGLPGPVLTPYLVGLLVMLGMLGTFLGMVVTLNGAVFALEGTTDLHAIRSAFAAPIKGLGLAFGTSVAGVATSAMLGLMSAISRHERLAQGHLLDTRVATVLRGFSLAYQRSEAYKALQAQSQALPAVVAQLQALMGHMEGMQQQLTTTLLHNQQGFHRDVHGAYTELADSVSLSLRTSLAEGARTAGESLQPVLQAAMAGLAQQTQTLQESLATHTGQQLQAQSDRFGTAYAELLSHAHAQAEARLASESAWAEQQDTRMHELVGMLRTELGALRDAETVRGQAAVERLGDLQTAVAQHLRTLGTALEDPISRLIATASEAPRAAAEVIGQLRQEVSASMVRDNALLDERQRILHTLNTLLEAINQASVEQRGVIDSLVASSATALDQANHQFARTVDTEAAKLGNIAAQVGSSAVEVSALGDTLGMAVRAFGQANDQLIANLQRIEGALDKSMARSDEQLAYYVAQAREVIDLSIMSQKDIVTELHRLSDRAARQTAEVAG